MDKTETINILQANYEKLRQHGVAGLYLFGSVVRGEDQATSDIDLLVEFQPGATIGLFEFARLRRLLSELLGRQVDLVTPDALHKELKDEILREAIRAA